jgi:flagellar biosynthesis protein FlhF
MIVSTDSYRAGATEQLRVYAAAIGVPFQIADSPLALSQILDEHGNKQLILIDTPGAAPSDMDMNADLARFLSHHPEVETHLVLPATASAATLAGTVRRFACFKPEKAILTKFDEADTYGAALGQVILSSLPISFLTTGQQVPDDLVAADKDRLLHFLAGSKGNRAASAA